MPPLPTARDPHSVPETVCNGPFNLAISGSLAIFTFTSIRPDPQELLYGASPPKLSAVVTARLVLPVEALTDLRNVIDQTLASQKRPSTGQPN
jgi:hypothetical protein